METVTSAVGPILQRAGSAPLGGGAEPLTEAVSAPASAERTPPRPGCTTILVVDDEPDLEFLVKQKFRRKIREGVYEFLFASHGQQALDQLALHPETDIVLADINMPVMDGLTLLSRVRDIGQPLKTVIVSAYGDMPNIRAAMNLGAFDFVCKPVDFADLEATIEKTAAVVRQLRDTLHTLQENAVLKMYVDATVLPFMVRHAAQATPLVSENVQATVVFIDICGFTSLSEKLPAHTVVQLLNAYFDQMVKEITAQGGRVDKFMGDALMAVFQGEYHLDRALDAALAVRALLHDGQPAPPFDELPAHPGVAIGINTGEMVSGNIGSASLRRFDYTVIGDVVNVSQRLQARAHAGQILITDATYQRIRESFSCQPVGEMTLRNRVAPVMVYEVVA